MTFAVVTVLHNSADDLGRLLSSLSRVDPAPTELVVVDAGSSDDGARIASEAGATVIDAGNVGFGAANNAGVAAVASPVTVLLNPDIVVDDRSTLGRLATFASGRDALHAPWLLNIDGSVQESAHPLPGSIADAVSALIPAQLLPGRIVPWRADSSRHAGWVIAAAVAARTGTLRALGPFDPRQFLFYEDLDLCLRAREAGVPTLLHPEIALTHRGGHSTGAAYDGEPLELLARRRRSVITANLGVRAARRDDILQAITFVRSTAARSIARRDDRRSRAQLKALLETRREP